MKLIERIVKLFEAGDYGDRGGVYSTDLLDEWVESHVDPIPFNMLHSSLENNPLMKLTEYGMGYARNLYREGAALFATLFLPEEINALIDKTGVKGVSVGVTPDKKRIYELSWVGKPRIPTAQVYSDEQTNEVAYSFSLDDAISESSVEDVTITENQEALTVAENTENTEQTPEVNETPVETKQEFSAEDYAAMKARAEAAENRANQTEAQLFAERDEAKVKELELAGKILPVHKEALLSFSGAGNINFSGEDTRVFDALMKFMESYDVSAVYEATQPATVEIPNPIETEVTVEFSDELYRAARQTGMDKEKAMEFAKLNTKATANAEAN